MSIFSKISIVKILVLNKSQTNNQFYLLNNMLLMQITFVCSFYLLTHLPSCPADQSPHTVLQLVVQQTSVSQQRKSAA